MNTPPIPTLATHGGPDAGPLIAHDFSTNANPLGPPPPLRRAVQDADRTRYPDPQYLALRKRLGHAHRVDAARIVPAAGGAEAIRRLTLAALLEGVREVWVPCPGFGDYALAAQALGVAVRTYAQAADIAPAAPALIWVCEPCNPTGASLGTAALAALVDAHADAIVAVDLAYAPLRLAGAETLVPARCWQLHCPNKALGLTGIRAGYLVAPAEDSLWARVLSLAPSWVLAAEGVAMLTHWRDAETAAWLADSRMLLREWTAAQRALLTDRFGWAIGITDTPFALARLPHVESTLQRLRAHGIKLRNAASFGLPDRVRIATLPPTSQEALRRALEEFI